MNKRDKVIKALQYCTGYSEICAGNECPYFNQNCDDLKNDVLEILREPEMRPGGEVEIKDLYEKMWDQIVKAFAEHNKMFLWIAERTLSVKDYKEFIDEFTKKPDSHKEILDFIQNKQE